MLKDLIFAILTPSRRMPVFAFAACQFLIASAIFITYKRLGLSGQGMDGAGPVAVMIMAWLNFCVLANRLHDGGCTSIWLVPPFMLGTFAFLADLDPSFLGTDWTTQDAWATRLLLIRHFLGLLGCIIFGLALKLPSDDHRNVYGMPLGETDAGSNKNLMRDVAAPQIRKIGHGHHQYDAPPPLRPTPAPHALARSNQGMPSADRLRRAGVVR